MHTDPNRKKFSSTNNMAHSELSMALKIRAQDALSLPCTASCAPAPRTPRKEGGAEHGCGREALRQAATELRTPEGREEAQRRWH